MSAVGTYLIPVMLFLIVVFGAVKKTDVYSAFTRGVCDGVKNLWGIFPTLFALFIAVGALRASGLLDYFCTLAKPVASFLHIPSELLPFIFLRPVSGSGSLVFAGDIFESCGPDSFAGRAVSVMMGSTETTFYTTAVYFGASGTRDIRYTLKCALLADCVSAAVSLAVCSWFY